ncbi:hypothetical protein SPRG_01477 [Saprolegnia parasitica CBS 223.65]|uniref:Uncharacterized protein n=1 Tax=Saprolegnia parasitica (strain CBS 223.65) TaxID=695850 RepID=A0A067D6M7_SAPPC|nr:hypothetical protein SPRG_01477 [Saprolegnia parasitica CBS 223.65]KDO34341.1 hypothetical protein SPRG_01477 [Saprolegnia parasitica CBS 223.65]|eukprot:XP_012195077.1 hypothetical protein SPRG_01477 [Saprolegnia parasitica CBS 223.65]
MRCLWGLGTTALGLALATAPPTDTSTHSSYSTSQGSQSTVHHQAGDAPRSIEGATNSLLGVPLPPLRTAATLSGAPGFGTSLLRGNGASPTLSTGWSGQLGATPSFGSPGFTSGNTAGLQSERASLAGGGEDAFGPSLDSTGGGHAFGGGYDAPGLGQANRLGGVSNAMTTNGGFFRA